MSSPPSPSHAAACVSLINRGVLGQVLRHLTHAELHPLLFVSKASYAYAAPKLAERVVFHSVDVLALKSSSLYRYAMRPRGLPRFGGVAALPTRDIHICLNLRGVNARTVDMVSETEIADLVVKAVADSMDSLWMLEIDARRRSGATAASFARLPNSVKNFSVNLMQTILNLIFLSKRRVGESDAAATAMQEGADSFYPNLRICRFLADRDCLHTPRDGRKKGMMHFLKSFGAFALGKKRAPNLLFLDVGDLEYLHSLKPTRKEIGPDKAFCYMIRMFAHSLIESPWEAPRIVLRLPAELKEGVSRAMVTSMSAQYPLVMWSDEIDF